MPPFLRGFRAAVVFLTRIPVGGGPYSSADWKWANAYLPLVGAIIGLASAGTWMVCQPLGEWPAALAAVAIGVLLTGAFHEDGLADSADALGGGIDDRERVLAILKDSRIGTYGSAALFLSLFARIALLQRLGVEHALALVLVHALARTPPVVMKCVMSYATQCAGAKSRDLEDAGWSQALVAVGIGLLLGFVLATSVTEFALFIPVIALPSCALALYFQRRVGGYTGDFLGATEQICEILLLGTLVVMRS